MNKHGRNILILMAIVALVATLLFSVNAAIAGGGNGKPKKCDSPPCSNPDGGGKDQPDADPGQGDKHDDNNGQGNDPDCQDDSKGQGVPGHCKEKPTEPPTETPTITPTPPNGSSKTPGPGDGGACCCCCEGHFGAVVDLPSFEFDTTYTVTINSVAWNFTVFEGTAEDNDLEVTEECFCVPNIVLHPELGKPLTLLVEDESGNQHVSEVIVVIQK